MSNSGVDTEAARDPSNSVLAGIIGASGLAELDTRKSNENQLCATTRHTSLILKSKELSFTGQNSLFRLLKRILVETKR